MDQAKHLTRKHPLIKCNFDSFINPGSASIKQDKTHLGNTATYVITMIAPRVITLFLNLFFLTEDSSFCLIAACPGCFSTPP